LIFRFTYPPHADRQGIGGPTDALVLAEDPLDVGFGAAACALANVMEYRNPTGQLAQLKFKVKFAPDGEHAPSQSATDVPAEPPPRR
jgi:hypothetical protein